MLRRTSQQLVLSGPCLQHRQLKPLLETKRTSPTSCRVERSPDPGSHFASTFALRASADKLLNGSRTLLLRGRVKLPLRQKADDSVSESVRLLHIRDVGGVENREARAGDLASDQFARGDRGCNVIATGDHQR